MTLTKLLTPVLVAAYSLGVCLSPMGGETRGHGQTALQPGVIYDVKAYGARGDGHTLDTMAINSAIDDASAHGGGTVHFPAGGYLSFSIRLRSNITLYLDQGAAIIAADPKDYPKESEFRYDLPEPNEWDAYQDFGHSHWHNSLIWGVNLENIAIVGPGLIDGRGLTRSGPGPRRPMRDGDTPNSIARNQPGSGSQVPLGERASIMNGAGNKAIALKLCRNILLRDFSILNGGHFALLATGADNLTIDNLKVDTNRDGLDIDACRNVRISNCSVNSPNDDAIVLKSSYALGYVRATENVTIANCLVSGYDIGSLLDATYKKTVKQAPDRDGPTGRLKFGTESNGGFRNIVISNVVFDHCRGLALETVDGGSLEDVTITNITMREIVTSPIFLRLGSRLRGPEGSTVGQLRRVTISNVVVYDAETRYASIISGIPGHYIEDVKLSNVRIFYRGGGTAAQAGVTPAELEVSYPEPSMFGEIPAYGFFIRHVKGLELNNVEVGYARDDFRPAFVVSDVIGADFFHVKAQHSKDAFAFVLRGVLDFSAYRCIGVPDLRLERVDFQKY